MLYNSPASIVLTMSSTQSAHKETASMRPASRRFTNDLIRLCRLVFCAISWANTYLGWYLRISLHVRIQWKKCSTLVYSLKAWTFVNMCMHSFIERRGALWGFLLSKMCKQNGYNTYHIRRCTLLIQLATCPYGPLHDQSRTIFFVKDIWFRLMVFFSLSFFFVSMSLPFLCIYLRTYSTGH